MAKQKEEVSELYGKPKFGLIVGLFAASIVLLLLGGWLFLRFDPLKLRSNAGPRTGMILVPPTHLIGR